MMLNHLRPALFSRRCHSTLLGSNASSKLNRFDGFVQNFATSWNQIFNPTRNSTIKESKHTMDWGLNLKRQGFNLAGNHFTSKLSGPKFLNRFHFGRLEFSRSFATRIKSHLGTSKFSSGAAEPETKKIVGYWYLFSSFLVFSIVILGGVTRLTESGLSIVEWNLIKGMKPPTSDQDWIEEFEKYKLFPEYQL